jgi:hypothetical protein
MTERERDNLAEWLTAEVEGDDDRADLLFAGLASTTLEKLTPPDGLTDRIVSAVPPPVRWNWRRWQVPDFAASLWVRVTAAAAVVTLGMALALLSPGHAVELCGRMVAAVAALVHGGLVTATAAWGVWWASLDVLSALGLAAGAVATTGIVPLLLAANLLLSVAAFAGLKRLLAPQEECA